MKRSWVVRSIRFTRNLDAEVVEAVRGKERYKSIAEFVEIAVRRLVALEKERRKELEVRKGGVEGGGSGESSGVGTVAVKGDNN